MTCSIPGCGRPVRARGWCGTHYRRWLRQGDPLAARRIGQRSDLDADRVIRLYTAGATARGIARLLGTNPTSVLRILQKHEIETREPGRQANPITATDQPTQEPEELTDKTTARRQKHTTTPRHPDPMGAAAAAEEGRDPLC